MKLAIRYSLFIFCLITGVTLQGVTRKPIPEPQHYGYINDYANILQENEKNALFRKLKAYEDSTSTQIAIIIEQTLNNRDPFDRSMDFARGWKVGQAGKNNGVVMYFAMKERKIFILNADKTQGNLPDGLTGSIIRNYITPYFKRGDYYTGINTGVNKIILALAGEFTNDGSTDKPSIFPIILFFLFVLFILYIASKGKGGRGGGYHRGGTYWFPTGTHGGGSGGGFSGGGFGGFGGGGGFNGGGAGGGW